MRVVQRGDGEPEVAVVGAIHGDEPCGVRAIEGFLERDLDVQRPVAFVIANERALAGERRFVEEDLNRAFPGDPDGESHESRLAAALVERIDHCLTLSLHSTRSHPDPFAVVAEPSDLVLELCPRLPVEAVVETGPLAEGRLFTSVETIEVECGLQGSADAAANASRIVERFLQAADVLPGEPPVSTIPRYRLDRPLPKEPDQDHEILVRNFERVEPGDSYARTNGRLHLADAPFYPVLLSADGYADVWGYAAEKVGEIP